MNRKRKADRGDDTSDQDNMPSTSKSQYAQKCRKEYFGEWPCFKESRKGELFVFCKVCSCDLNIAHGGRDDCRRHLSSKKHKEYVELESSNKSLTSMGFFSSKKVPKTENYSSTKAEVLFTNFLVEHNIPLSASDHASQLFQKMFPDSMIAKEYSAARTKTSNLLREQCETLQASISEKLVSQPYCIATDGSNDDEKLYPVVVRYFDTAIGQVREVLLSVPTLNKDSATGENIFNLLDQELVKRNINWDNCLALSSDNASVMTGIHKGVFSFISAKNDSVYMNGCTCHLISLAAKKGAKHIPVSIDDLLVDIYHYLDKSVKRKSELKEIQTLCDCEQLKVLKHCSTRWLSLGTGLKRLLDQWRPLKVFFECEETKLKLKKGTSTSKTSKKSSSSAKSSISGHKTQPSSSSGKAKSGSSSGKSGSGSSSGKAKPVSFSGKTNKKRDLVSVSGIAPAQGTSAESVSKESRVNSDKYALDKVDKVLKALTSRRTKLYCLFLNYIIPLFDKFNLLMQKEEPMIHKLRACLIDMYRQILVKFVKAREINIVDDILDVDYKAKEKQKVDSSLVIGSDAKEYIEESNIDSAGLSEFYNCVRAYFVEICDYMKCKFPLKEELLKHAEVADVSRRMDVDFGSIKYFINRFSSVRDLTSDVKLDEIEQEFLNFQIDGLNSEIINCTRADTQWFLIGKLVATDDSGAKIPKYVTLPSIMMSVVVLPHSNAACERVFSFVGKTHTKSRSSMSMNTLEALLVVKQFGGLCYELPLVEDIDFLKRAKSATYNNLNK